MSDAPRRETILIVDDEPANIDVLVQSLPDYERSIALNGETALTVCRSKRLPDLVLLDIMMPGMDGHEVCRHLKGDDRTKAIPVIFITAKGETVDKIAGFGLGADDYLVKPIDPHLVRLRVIHHLELKRHRERLQELVQERTAQLEAAMKIVAAGKVAAEAGRAAAEAGNRAKSDFMMIMSHELRTPLNSIVGFTPFLADAGLEETLRRQYVELVTNAGNDLLDLVNEIIDLVQVEISDVQLKPRSFALVERMQKIVDVVSPRAREKGLMLTSHIDPDLPPFLVGDDQRLSQVLLHLLKNAIKFTSSGSVVLEVTRETSSPEERLLCFAVRDTGIGISPDKRDTIFQHFTQLESPFNRQHGGIGLGLAVCKQFAALMGGQIRVESALGQGSTFHLTVPFGIGQEPQEVVDPQDSKPAPRHRVRKKTGGTEVLVPVESNPKKLDHRRRIFLDEGPVHLRALEQALNEQKATQAQAQTERFKTMATEIGAIQVKAKLVRIGMAVRGEEWDRAVMLCQELQQEFNRAVVLLSEK